MTPTPFRFLVVTLACLLPCWLVATELPSSGRTLSPQSLIPTQLDQRTLEKRIDPIIEDLALADAAKAAIVRATLELHFQALQAWHADHHIALMSLWVKWSDARTTGKKDEARAAEVGREIDAVYATFQPQHKALLAQLAMELTAEQIDTVKDTLTRSPGLSRTYNAYLEIVPNATDADKKFFWQTLAVAREKAMDALTGKEKADQFKRQKILIEAYIDARGYDWKKSYAAYAERLKAQAAAKDK